jgi:nicotinate-nucleotide adenylyltransferase
MMKIGVLGGSFNPIHNGHLAVARAAAASLSLDTVLFIPAKTPPHKPGKELAPAQDRLAMTRLAVKGNATFAASDIELSRPSTSYTIDTIKELRALHGRDVEVFFLIGADTIGELSTWKDVAQLVTLCTFVTVARPGWSEKNFDDLAGTFEPQVVDSLKQHFITMDPVPVSSTEIRTKVARGENISGLVPKAVEEYITEHGLYKGL